MVAPKSRLEPDGLTPIEVPNFQAQVIFEVINFLIQLLEKRTITETFQGLGGKRQTATEASMLQQQSQQPVQARTDLLARVFLEPAFNICMAMVCEFVVDDQTFYVRDAANQMQPVTITLEELRNHKYVVTTTLTRQDASRIARMQSLERIMPQAAQMEPLVMRDGRRISFSEIFQRYLDAMDLDGVDRILVQMTPQEQAAAMQPPPMPPGSEGPQGGGGMPPGGPEPPMAGPEGGPMGTGGDEDMVAQLLQHVALQGQGGGM